MQAKQQLICEIESARRTLKSYMSMGAAAEAVAECKASLATQLQIKIRNVGSMTSAENADVLEVLADSDKLKPYTDASMKAIWGLLMQRQTDGLTDVASSKRPRRTAAVVSDDIVQHGQHLTSQIVRFLTEEDWAIILDRTKSIDLKYKTIALRFSKLGLIYASQQTRKWVVALLALSAYDTYPKYRVVYNMQFDFARHMLGEKGASTISWPLIHVYPASPEELAPEVWNNAYSTDGPPVARDIPNLADTAERHVPLRNNAKLIVDEEKVSGTPLLRLQPPRRSASSASSASGDANMSTGGFDISELISTATKQIASQFMSQMCSGHNGMQPFGSWQPANNFAALGDSPGQNGPATPSPPARPQPVGRPRFGLGGDHQVQGAPDERHHPCRAAGAAADEDRACDAAAAADAAEKSEKLPGVLAYEKAALEEASANAAKKAKAKAAAKAKAKTAAKAGTKAVAATTGRGKGGGKGKGKKHTIKESAVAAGDGAKPLKVDLSDILVRSVAKNASSYNSYCCRGYSAAVKACKDKGSSADVTEATRKACYAACAKFYHQVHSRK